MKRARKLSVSPRLALLSALLIGGAQVASAQFADKSADRNAMSKASLNPRTKAVRIIAYRAKQHERTDRLADYLPIAWQHPQPRVRFAGMTSAPASIASPAAGFEVDEQRDRLRISLGGKPIVDFVYRDARILRPYFANARLADDRQVTRNHPPVKDVDAVDHDTMHPGIWLGFGDISGQDFWRNKATMEHVRFVTAPATSAGRLRFATECRLKTSAGDPLCLLTNDIALSERPNGWMLRWSATFHADQREIVFGDQEEMGFGARVATPFTEKNGGVLASSTGKKTAKETWGQPARWCDYSGNGPQSGGIMLMASETNFRESWWHNRDYGVFVANPFGREAMKQGARSAITVAPGKTMKITFGALIHDHREFDRDAEFAAFNRENR